MGHLKFEYFSFYSRTVGFYLGRGATWVVGLKDVDFLAWPVFSEVTLYFTHLTYVLVVPGYM